MEAEEAAVRGEEGNFLIRIPDEITLHHIFTKLPWTAIFPVSRVNRKWRRVVKSRQLYDARVSTGCTTTLIPMHRAPRYATHVYASCWKSRRVTQEEILREGAMSLLDPDLETWNLLPPVPPLLAGIPEGCGCACLNGKVYVLGGRLASPRDNLNDALRFSIPSLDNGAKMSRKDVYSLDLAAGDTTWTKCADMTCAKAWFHCDVNDGNIYAFWGVKKWTTDERNLFQNAVTEVEVYDPEEDLWDRVDPVPFPNIIKDTVVNKFGTVGDTFIIYSYFRFEGLLLERTYDTDKDEWKVVQYANSQTYPTNAFVTINQKLHSFNPKNSTPKEDDEEPSSSFSSACLPVSWQFLSSRTEPMALSPGEELRGLGGWLSFSGIQDAGQPQNFPPGAKEVREVLTLTFVESGLKGGTLVSLTRTTGDHTTTQFRDCSEELALFSGKWSGQDEVHIVMQEIDCPHTLLDWQNYALHPLHL